MKPNMAPLTVALCLSGLLVFSGCTDTLFNTKGGKLVQKEGVITAQESGLYLYDLTKSDPSGRK